MLAGLPKPPPPFSLSQDGQEILGVLATATQCASTLRARAAEIEGQASTCTMIYQQLLIRKSNPDAWLALSIAGERLKKMTEVAKWN